METQADSQIFLEKDLMVILQEKQQEKQTVTHCTIYILYLLVMQMVMQMSEREIDTICTKNNLD